MKVSAQGRHKSRAAVMVSSAMSLSNLNHMTAKSLCLPKRVVGGAVPKNFFPAVEKGLNECMDKGVLAGYPMVGVKATLL